MEILEKVEKLQKYWLSIEKIARLCDVSVSTINRRKTGEAIPSSKTQSKMKSNLIYWLRTILSEME